MVSTKIKILTRIMPHPVGVKAKMHTIISLTVICGRAINVIKIAKNVIKTRPFINLNASW